MLRYNQDKSCNNFNLTNINSITLNTQAAKDNQVITQSYVDQFHQKNERKGKNLGIDFLNEHSDLVKTNQDNDFHYNARITNLDIVTNNRNPSTDKELSNKKRIDNEFV